MHARSLTEWAVPAFWLKLDWTVGTKGEDFAHGLCNLPGRSRTVGHEDQVPCGYGCCHARLVGDRKCALAHEDRLIPRVIPGETSRRALAHTGCEPFVLGLSQQCARRLRGSTQNLFFRDGPGIHYGLGSVDGFDTARGRGRGYL